MGDETSTAQESSASLVAEAPHARRRWRWAGVALAVAALIAAACLLPVGAWLGALATLIAGCGPLGLAIFMCAFVAWSTVLPKAPLVALAGLTYGFETGLLLTYAGATAAIGTGFWLARRLGRDRAHAWMRRSPRAHAWGQAIGADAGIGLLVLLRLSPVLPFQVQNWLYGMSGVPFARCVVAAWIGMLPATALCVAGGAAASAQGGWLAQAGWWLVGVGIIAGAGAVVTISRLARARLALAASVPRGA